MKKRAFSVIELLVASVIVGVVVIVGIQSAKKATESYDNYYYAAYNILSKAVYNAYLTEGGDEIFENHRSLCEALTKYINTTNTSCTKYGKFAALSVTGTMGPPPDSNNASFKAVNGMIFNIAQNNFHPDDDEWEYNYNDGSGEVSATLSPRLKFAIIMVDLNGEKGPNNSRYQYNVDLNKLPDRVYFAILNKGGGSVVPLGLPNIDRRYFQVRVILPEYQYEIDDATGKIKITNEEVRLQPFKDDGSVKPLSDSNPMINKTPPMSLQEARIFAWGDSSNDSHEGFYEFQPMSYYKLLTDEDFRKKAYCGSFTGDKKTECESRVEQTFDANNKNHVMMTINYFEKFQTFQKSNTTEEEKQNTIKDFTMTAGSLKAKPIDVNGAMLEYGCTPNNSECYIIPLRN